MENVAAVTAPAVGWSGRVVSTGVTGSKILVNDWPYDEAIGELIVDFNGPWLMGIGCVKGLENETFFLFISDHLRNLRRL